MYRVRSQSARQHVRPLDHHAKYDCGCHLLRHVRGSRHSPHPVSGLVSTAVPGEGKCSFIGFIHLAALFAKIFTPPDIESDMYTTMPSLDVHVMVKHLDSVLIWFIIMYHFMSSLLINHSRMTSILLSRQRNSTSTWVVRFRQHVQVDLHLQGYSYWICLVEQYDQNEPFSIATVYIIKT